MCACEGERESADEYVLYICTYTLVCMFATAFMRERGREGGRERLTENFTHM